MGADVCVPGGHVDLHKREGLVMGGVKLRRRPAVAGSVKYEGRSLKQ